MPEEPDDEFLDGCDIDFTLAEQTSDEELPLTFGGVAIEAQGLDGFSEEDLDGCEIDFTAMAETLDDDLPVTTGGVG